MGVAKSNLATMSNHSRLASDNRAKTSLQAGLELAGHQGIVGPSLGQDAEVQGEQAQVENGGDHRQHANPHLVMKKI